MALVEIFPPYGEGLGVEDWQLTGSNTGLVSQTHAVRHFVCLPSEATAQRDALKNTAYPLDSSLTCYRVRLVRQDRTFIGCSRLTAYYKKIIGGGLITRRYYIPSSTFERVTLDLDGNRVQGADGNGIEYRITYGDRYGQRFVPTGRLVVEVELISTTLEPGDFNEYLNRVNSNTYAGFPAGTLLYMGPAIHEDFENARVVFRHEFLHDARGWNNLLRSTPGKRYAIERIKYDDSLNDTGDTETVIEWKATGSESARRLYDTVSISSIPTL